MNTPHITALAHPNIAFIKYWGDRDPRLHIPSSNSVSMNLSTLYTKITLSVEPDTHTDKLVINDIAVTGAKLQRIATFLDHVRRLGECSHYFQIVSHTNFPTGAGIASSAAAFASLSVAASALCDLAMDEASLSRLARLGSGSACRSIPAGFVEWNAGENHLTSYAYSLHPASHWNLYDCIAIIDQSPKTTSSIQGHTLADTSPLQAGRLEDIEQRLKQCKDAIQRRDFDALAAVVEPDSDMMHAVMMTSSPPLFYWLPASLGVMLAVREWRAQGLPACYTLDAGANVHVICTEDYHSQVTERLKQLNGVIDVLSSPPGSSATLIE